MAETSVQGGNSTGPAAIATFTDAAGNQTQLVSLVDGIASGGHAQDVIGPTNETAPGTDTAQSGLNGRLQRVAQRLSSIIGLLPTSLTGSGNLKIAVVESTITQPVSGTVGVSGSIGGTVTVGGTAAISGTVTANAGTNLNTSLLALEAGGNLATIAGRLPTALTVSGNFKTALVESTITQPVSGTVGISGSIGGTVTVGGTAAISGTVTANAGTNLNTSLLAIESGGNLATIVARLPTALTGSGNLKTAIVEITATQPVSGTVGISGSIGGTVTIGGTATISGTVTANAGTNLNTSLLALESGGNLATIVGRLPTSLTVGASALKIGHIYATPSSTLTRAGGTVPYAANQLIANSLSGGTALVVPSFTAVTGSVGTGRIFRTRLSTNGTAGMANVQLQVALWGSAPTFTNGDQTAFSVTTGAANFMGTFTVQLTQAGDGAYGVAAPDIGQQLNFALASGTAIYWTLQTLTAFTPAAGQTFTLVPEIEQE